MGYQVEERPINIDEIVEAYQAGTLKEVFGTGTAATISMIRELRYKEFRNVFPGRKLGRRSWFEKTIRCYP